MGDTMETLADRIARKHERQLARRRVRTCEEIRGEVEQENELHARNIVEERTRHGKRTMALLDELKRVGG